ncbi:ketopantoate reductase family protein [Massilimicrobiota sp. An134]|uniref:ketopantoate reductase family protein n=1 Tax=Massilimicrobiota sp. An134 TaxID=1965557 RepID=UPI000B39BFA3|nr:ketopantoate reductase family protein [Massilimicrobiota sp. An134]OUQ28452.1 2-dehydropantoate 2-reductase [Massilimicrobiota sp. An134]
MDEIAIIGAGAVGAAYGSVFIKNNIQKFSFVANGERANRLLKNGIKVNNEVLYPNVSTGENHGKIKLLLVLVKNYSLESSIEDIQSVIDDNTIILSLLNGVTAVDFLKEKFPNNKVLYGIVMRTDANRIDDNITFQTLGEIQFGEEENIEFSDDVKYVIDIFEKNKIKYHVYEDMVRMLWRKWMVNIGANQISLLTQAKFKYFGEFPEIKKALNCAMQEIVDIAKKKEIHLTTKDKDDMIEVLIHYPPEKKTSMLQDLEAGRKTEIDYFGGTVMKLGKECGVPTPVNEILYYIVKAREKVNCAEHQLSK